MRAMTINHSRRLGHWSFLVQVHRCPKPILKMCIGKHSSLHRPRAFSNSFVCLNTCIIAIYDDTSVTSTTRGRLFTRTIGERFPYFRVGYRSHISHGVSPTPNNINRNLIHDTYRRPTTCPSLPVNYEPVPPWREVYKARGLLDPNYVFSKPPRPQRLRSPSEKHKSKDRSAASRSPLSTHPSAKPQRS